MANEVINEIKKRIQEIKAERRRVEVLIDEHNKKLKSLNKAVEKLNGDIELANEAIRKLKEDSGD